MKLGKIEGKNRIREGDGKNNATILGDWKVEDDSSQRIKFFDKNLRFHTRTKRDTLLIVSNMKFHKNCQQSVFRSLFITPSNDLKLDTRTNN